MRKVGPMIACAFYATQALHAFLFYTVFGPAVNELFDGYPKVAVLWQVVGWLLCFKVTYLYYLVNTSSPGVPSRVLK